MGFPAMMLTNCQSHTDSTIDKQKLTIDEISLNTCTIMQKESCLSGDKELSRAIENLILQTSNRSDRISRGVAVFTQSSLGVKL